MELIVNGVHALSLSHTHTKKSEFVIASYMYNQFAYDYNCLRIRLDRTYFMETENWKHCNKIIFKCVNNIVGFIFNEKVV